MSPDRNVRIRPSPRTKVFWSQEEKDRVIARAIEIQSERPEMAGLPLLREAMLALPSSRRRKVIAMSQVPWFENGMRAEVKHRASEKAAASSDASSSAATMRILHDEHADWRVEHAEWRNAQLEVLKQILDTLKAAVDKLDVISGKLGSPVPSYAQAQSQAQAQAQAKARTRRHAN